MKASPRPQAVTLACAFVGISALLMLLELVGALTNWGTIEMQEGLRPTLTRLNDSGFDITMVELLRVLRWTGMGFVLLAVAGVVFAAYAFRGDRVSRVGTTVVAGILGVLVLAFGWIGLLQSVFLLTAAIMLWSGDARRWFDAKSAPGGGGGAAEPAAEGPRPPDAWAAPSADTRGAETPAPTQTETLPPNRPTNRPQAVLAAGLVTVIGSSIAGTMAALYLLIYSFARAEIVRGVQEGPFADMYQAGEIDDGLRTVFWASLVVLPLGFAGLGAGLSLLARLPFGRVATLALAWITGAVGIVMIPLGLLGTGAAIAVIVLLNRDDARAWTAAAR